MPIIAHASFHCSIYTLFIRHFVFTLTRYNDFDRNALIKCNATIEYSITIYSYNQAGNSDIPDTAKWPSPFKHENETTN
jgi:hypothetical protein